MKASAAALKSLATCLYPSSSALWAKARYFLLAWLSPAKAAFRFYWTLNLGEPSGWEGLNQFHVSRQPI